VPIPQHLPYVLPPLPNGLELATYFAAPQAPAKPKKGLDKPPALIKGKSEQVLLKTQLVDTKQLMADAIVKMLRFNAPEYSTGKGDDSCTDSVSKDDVSSDASAEADGLWLERHIKHLLQHRFKTINDKHIILKGLKSRLKQMVQENKKMVHFDKIEDKKEREEAASEIMKMAMMGAPDFLNLNL
jgi:hypothetical protein